MIVATAPGLVHMSLGVDIARFTGLCCDAWSSWRMEAPVATVEDVDARLAECAESCWHALNF